MAAFSCDMLGTAVNSRKKPTIKLSRINLSLVSLNQSAVEITEMLRNGTDIEGAKDMLPIVQKNYDAVIEAIGLLED